MRSPVPASVKTWSTLGFLRFIGKLVRRIVHMVAQNDHPRDLARFMRSATLPLVWQITLIVCIPNAKGAVTIAAVEAGGNVVFSGSGTLNLSDLYHYIGGGSVPGINPATESVPVLVLGASGNNVDEYGLGNISFPAPFGTGGHIPASIGAGDVFGTTVSLEEPGQAVIWVPSGYVSGSWLSGSITFTGETFATLGLIPGVYTWSWGYGENADSMTLVIPEPSIGLLALLGLVSTMRRRR